jgi:hypothetical protein
MRLGLHGETTTQAGFNGLSRASLLRSVTMPRLSTARRASLSVAKIRLARRFSEVAEWKSLR